MRRRSMLCAVVALGPAAAFAQTDFSYCTLPGELVAEDAATDVVPASGTGLDLGAVHIAEPADDEQGRLHFSLQIDRPAAAATPQTRYLIEFTTPDGVERYLAYTPYPIAPAGSVFAGDDQMFAIGHYEDVSGFRGAFYDGPADADSSAGADGRITFVIKRKALGRINEGDTIDDIVASTRIYNLTGTFIVDASDVPGMYPIRGNDTCAGKNLSKEGRTLLAGAVAPPLLLLLAGSAFGRGLRRRP